MFKQENGITLVALVITIIVLLILAGVSISLVMGDNGVLSQANHAVTNTELASVKDEISMAMTTVQTNYYATYGNVAGRSSILAELKNSTKMQQEFPNATSVYVNDAGTELYYAHKNGQSYYKASLTPTTESITVNSVEAINAMVTSGTQLK